MGSVVNIGGPLKFAIFEARSETGLPDAVCKEADHFILCNLAPIVLHLSSQLMDATHLRRWVHQHPDLSGSESNTSEFLQTQLGHLGGWTFLPHLGESASFVAIFDTGRDGPTIGFRAELDALPISECTSNELITPDPSDAEASNTARSYCKTWHSENRSTAHLCGHDGHMSILYEVAQRISRKPPLRGRIALVFQTEEETGKGARRIVADPRFSELVHLDRIFALHNLPGHRLGEVLLIGPSDMLVSGNECSNVGEPCQPQRQVADNDVKMHSSSGLSSSRSSDKRFVFACASRGVEIRLRGLPSHASWPEKGRSPLDALLELVAFLKALKPQTPERFSLVTIVSMGLGEPFVFGTAPADAYLMATVRTAENADMEEMVASILEAVEKTAVNHGLQHSVKWHDVFGATSNHLSGLQDVLCAASMVRNRHEYQRNVTVQSDSDNLRAKEVSRDNDSHTEKETVASSLSSECPSTEHSLQISISNSPMRWSEDFGEFLDCIPGAMFALGAGTATPELHTERYDFPDELIAIGADVFETLARMHCGE